MDGLFIFLFVSCRVIDLEKQNADLLEEKGNLHDKLKDITEEIQKEREHKIKGEEELKETEEKLSSALNDLQVRGLFTNRKISTV